MLLTNVRNRGEIGVLSLILRKRTLKKFSAVWLQEYLVLLSNVRKSGEIGVLSLKVRLGLPITEGRMIYRSTKKTRHKTASRTDIGK